MSRQSGPTGTDQHKSLNTVIKPSAISRSRERLLIRPSEPLTRKDLQGYS